MSTCSLHLSLSNSVHKFAGAPGCTHNFSGNLPVASSSARSMSYRGGEPAATTSIHYSTTTSVLLLYHYCCCHYYYTMNRHMFRSFLVAAIHVKRPGSCSSVLLQHVQVKKKKAPKKVLHFNTCTKLSYRTRLWRES